VGIIGLAICVKYFELRQYKIVALKASNNSFPLEGKVQGQKRGGWHRSMVGFALKLCFFLCTHFASVAFVLDSKE